MLSALKSLIMSAVSFPFSFQASCDITDEFLLYSLEKSVQILIFF